MEDMELPEVKLLLKFNPNTREVSLEVPWTEEVILEDEEATRKVIEDILLNSIETFRGKEYVLVSNKPVKTVEVDLEQEGELTNISITTGPAIRDSWKDAGRLLREGLQIVENRDKDNWVKVELIDSKDNIRGFNIYNSWNPLEEDPETINNRVSGYLLQGLSQLNKDDLILLSKNESEEGTLGNAQYSLGARNKEEVANMLVNYLLTLGEEVDLPNLDFFKYMEAKLSVGNMITALVILERLGKLHDTPEAVMEDIMKVNLNLTPEEEDKLEEIVKEVNKRFDNNIKTKAELMMKYKPEDSMYG